MNSRVKFALQSLQVATENLAEILRDLSVRENDPLFQKAKSLFDQGYRLYDYEPDVCYAELTLWFRSKRWGEYKRTFIARATGGRNYSHRQLLGVTTPNEFDGVVRYLLHLSEEDSSPRDFT